jgi:hypothetical protein
MSESTENDLRIIISRKRETFKKFVESLRSEDAALISNALDINALNVNEWIVLFLLFSDCVSEFLFSRHDLASIEEIVDSVLNETRLDVRDSVTSSVFRKVILERDWESLENVFPENPLKASLLLFVVCLAVSDKTDSSENILAKTLDSLYPDPAQ